MADIYFLDVKFMYFKSISKIAYELSDWLEE